ncbi:DUF3486 family protein [Shewanella oneidensis MR-1]|uniref:Mu phage small terminase subunit GpD n=1 Tax=Shewanella oneidensis (strain ATCC 700550 / JCM 31522 / CIP 106686 / LMG 19005 / NCIMB 14063 / MR-1) TaxID=211586 RepID=Q8EJ10_SHEON|nr:DUF3486 family protein [Shewanella oneidensis]AAN53743.1 Mu phage small terminase subunit GpD [Shewanella oneidensis MR-1]MDX5997414.1 DUF3486 family protein [Shewanella oneidensis]MEE2030218.1 hypothetical protein [Shewanella oneidensis]QKG95550.1 DUF3486 family protein [Shewanella oneidensis MR-1]
MANETRGRRSKVDLLPANIRKRLDSGLRDGSIQQTELLEEINALIKAAGLPKDNLLSRAGINRYATKMEAVGKSLREMREITQVWTAELGDKPTGEVTKFILEIGRSQLLKAMLNESESDMADVGLIKDAMLAVQRLESAAMASHKREKEIRQAFAAEAAHAAEKVAKSAGLTSDAVAMLKREILGIA